MNKMQKVYLAGLFDGEGYFLLEKCGQGFKPIIGIDMTCKKTIDYVHAAVGYGTILVKKTNPAHKPQWKWRARSNYARRFALELFPFLITKKEAAGRLIAHVRLKRGRKAKVPSLADC